MKAILFIVFFSSSNNGTSQAIEFKSFEERDAFLARLDNHFQEIP
jgi:hypothetical protein